MLRRFRIGSLLGFPVELNLTFLLLLAATFLWMGGVVGLVVVALAFGSVLLHELGHALVARHLGVPVAGIELHFFGGAAKMIGQPRNAGDEIAIAAAGPAVSFALAGLGWVLAALTGAWLFTVIAWLNTGIGVFNLIPALPMDGGRILRALMARRIGFARATERAVQVARVMVVLIAVAAVALRAPLMLVLAGVLWWMGTAELRMARLRGYGDQPEAAHGRVPGAARGLGASEEHSREAASTGRAPRGDRWPPRAWTASPRGW
jgi:Zn-dependent protease